LGKIRPLLQGDRKYLPVLAGVLAWVALVGLIQVLAYYADAKARLEVAGVIRSALGEARDEIDRRLETALAVPETLAAVIAAGAHIDQPRFDAIASRLVRANPSIRGVAIAPGGVITLIYPLRGNEAALGLRFADVPDQYEAVLQAIGTQRTVVAGPIPLVQGGTGLVSRTPVFLRGEAGGDTRYWGIVSLVVDVEPLFADIAGIAARNDLSVAVRSVANGNARSMISGDPAIFAAAPVTAYYPLPGGGRWELAAVPRAGWDAVRGVPIIARVVLHLLALVLGWATWRLFARHDQDLMLAGRDALTGLLNRKSFDQELAAALMQAKPRSSVLVLIDLDQFKPVNDHYGHSAGDVVLRRIGERLAQCTPAPDAAYRLGGDEFALLLRGERTTRVLFHQVDHVLQRIGEAVTLPDGRRVSVGASAGIAVFPLGGQSERGTEVFDRADRALYRSKAQGNRGVLAEPHGHVEAHAGELRDLH
jgi:diguanylate cyclase (GGDEF)-like protein